MIKLSVCLWPEHLKFHLEPMQLHIKVRKNKGGGGGEGAEVTYKVKHPGIDFCPCSRRAGHSLETDQAFFCINSGKHTQNCTTCIQTKTDRGSSVFQTVRSPDED